MSGSVNKAILVGNVGQDPQIRSLTNGGKVAELRIATSESWKDRTSGERQEKTEWHTVSVFNEGLIATIENYVKKGDKLYIEGQIQTRKYQDNQGQDKYSTEIVLRGFNAVLTMLSGKGDGAEGGQSRGGGQSGGQPRGGGQNGGQSGGQSRGGGQGGRQQQPAGGMPDFDDDVPF